MLTAINKDGISVLAESTERSSGPFCCKQCKKPVVLKKGNIKIHHFAHSPDLNCSFGKGESVAHMKAKMEVYHAFLSKGYPTQIEFNHNGLISDVLVFINNSWVGIEVQRSGLSIGELIDRTELYRTLGIPVLWIALPKKKIGQWETMHRSQWHEFLEKLYGDTIFFWSSGSEVIPTHFYPHFHYIEQTEYGGGYSKRNKRKKYIYYGAPISIVDMVKSAVNIYGSEYLVWGPKEKISWPTFSKFYLTDKTPDK